MMHGEASPRGVRRISLSDSSERAVNFAWGDALPDLLEVQIQSFDGFKSFVNDELAKEIRSRIQALAFEKSSRKYEPTEEDRRQLEGLAASFDDTEPDTLTRDFRHERLSYRKAVNVRIGEKEETLFTVPALTPSATFVIKGQEKAFLTQMVNAPGIVFSWRDVPPRQADLRFVRIIPEERRGPWLTFEVSKKGVLELHLRGKKVPAATFFRALDVELDAKHLGKDFEKTPLGKSVGLGDEAPLSPENLKQLYAGTGMKDPPNDPEELRKKIRDYFFNPDNPKRFLLGERGRNSLNRALWWDGETEDSPGLTPEDVERLALCLTHPHDWPALEIFDSPDALTHKTVRGSGHFLKAAVLEALDGQIRRIPEWKRKFDEEKRKGKRTEGEEFRALDALLDHAHDITRSIDRSLRDYKLLQSLEQENPLAELTQKRQLSVFGPGGISSRQGNETLRLVDRTHRGRICPIETSGGGMRAGLAKSLALSARVDECRGTISAPFLSEAEGGGLSVRWLDSEEEPFALQRLGQAPKDLDELRGKPCTTSADATGLMIRRYGFPSFDDPPEDAAVPLGQGGFLASQMFSVSGSLIPFIEHDDAHRALMGANMQRQALPLLYPQAPYVGTGVERRVVGESRTFPRARAKGTVVYADGATVKVRYDEPLEDGLRSETFELPAFERTRKGEAKRLRPLVRRGERVDAGQVLADGFASDGGEVALGANLLAAYLCWDGYNYEDGIVISQRVIDEDLFTSVHVHECNVELRDVKIPDGAGQGRTKTEKEHVQAGSKKRFGWHGRHLGEDGLVRVGSEVGPGDVLAARFSPTPRAEIDPVELFEHCVRRANRLNADTLARLYTKPSVDLPRPFRVPAGVHGTVIAVDPPRESPDEGVNEVITIRIAQTRKVEVGDKLAGRHGNKGVISKILPTSEMPFLADGTPVDVILNPLGVLSRLNVGQLYECALGWAAAKGGVTEGPDGPPRSLVACPAFDSPGKERIDELVEKANERVEALAGRGFEGEPRGFAATLDQGKTTLYDGATGEPFPEPVAVGYVYLMKLHHMVQDKMHARATGPYSLVEQQPVSGRSANGGQRLGDMEIWALEAYGASRLVREFMTDHSDARGGRERLEEEISKIAPCDDSEPEPEESREEDRLPEATEALFSYLRALCLRPEYPAWDEGSEDARFKLRFGVEDFTESQRVSTSQVYAFDKSANPTPVKGGLLDPAIFGEGVEERRSRMGYIQLDADATHPITHPWFKGEKATPAVIEKLPVLPVDLRPVRKRPDGSFTSDDLNFLYGAVILANDRLKRIRACRRELRKKLWQLKKGSKKRYRVVRLKRLDALFDKLIAEGTRQLQVAVDQLLDNDHAEPKAVKSGGKPYVSIADRLSGKAGIFRKRLLGKRVDFSGRSVIVPEPELAFDECGIPFEMARELFRYQIHARDPEGKKVPDEILKQMQAEGTLRVLLNRAPTLHRMGIQAYKPIFVKGKAIRFHPLSCAAFNADFDGDTMAVFVPLKEDSLEEVEKRLLAPLNVLSPADGRALAVPAQDMVIGLYGKGATEKERQELSRRIWQDVEEAEKVDRPSLPERLTKGNLAGYVLKVCRAFIEAEDPDASADERDADIARVAKAAPVLDHLMRLGFEGSTRSGLTLSYADLAPSAGGGGSGPLRRVRKAIEVVREVAGEAEKRLGEAYEGHGHAKTYLQELNRYWGDFASNLVDELLRDALKAASGARTPSEGDGPSGKERLRQRLKQGPLDGSEEGWPVDLDAVIDGLVDGLDWDETSDGAVSPSDLIAWDPVMAITDSGARGSASQVRQVIAFRGLMKGSFGEPIDIPVAHGLAEGMTADDYWLTTYGSRRDVIDTALGTASTGELARTIVNAIQDVVVVEEDCSTERGRWVDISGGDPHAAAQLVGRFITAHKKGEEEIALESETCIESAEQVEALREEGVSAVLVRSPLTCEAQGGVCAHCYGWDLSRQAIAQVGDAVGIIAAHSLSEQATQSNLSGFHGGGVAEDGIAEGLPGLKSVLNATLWSTKEKRAALVGKSIEDVRQIVFEKLRTAVDRNHILIDDKHLEVIVRSMVCSKPGDTFKITKDTVRGMEYLAKHLASLLAACAVGQPRTVIAQKIRDAKDGVAVDPLEGMKENLILGRPVPVGDEIQRREAAASEKAKTEQAEEAEEMEEERHE